eukprot:scaffold2841_cov176-Ochromonas_danica.AAC.3
MQQQHEDSLPSTPWTIEEAKASPYWPQWLQAIQKERNELLQRNVLKPIDDLPVGRKAIPTKLAFRVSKLTHGSLKFKARFCPKGCFQQAGVDYNDVYSPTLNFNSLCIILHLAAKFNWKITYIDIGNAYAEAPRDRPLYVQLTNNLIELGFSTTKYNEVMQNIYGMKQAGELWHNYLASKMKEFGLIRLASDVCTFTHSNQSESECLIVMIYVDDILIVGNHHSMMDQLVQFLKRSFRSIKIAEEFDRFIGIDVMKNGDHYYLTQENYCDDIVRTYVPPHIKSISTPISAYSKLNNSQGDQPAIQTQVGKLRFLADRTRPDLLIATENIKVFKGNMQY